MELAVKSFKKSYSNMNILILGDMLELGDYTLTAHKEIIRLAKKLSFSKIITVGENFKKTGILLIEKRSLKRINSSS